MAGTSLWKCPPSFYPPPQPAPGARRSTLRPVLRSRSDETSRFREPFRRPRYAPPRIGQGQEELQHRIARNQTQAQSQETAGRESEIDRDELKPAPAQHPGGTALRHHGILRSTARQLPFGTRLRIEPRAGNDMNPEGPGEHHARRNKPGIHKAVRTGHTTIPAAAAESTQPTASGG